ncbi:unnamed protein product, partial [Polarella glacialis]
VAKKASITPYPPHWSEELDAASGALYFYNDVRDESLWRHPLSETFREVLEQVGQFVTERLRLDQLAARIEEVLAEIQRRASEELEQWIGPLQGGEDFSDSYFYNSQTGLSSWEDPRERWKYDIHVRYDLLVGYLVAEERVQAQSYVREGRQGAQDLTTTLTSLVSSMSSVNSVLANSLGAADRATGGYTGDPDDPEASGARWARPARRRRGGLPLPPRATASSGAGDSATRALFSMPPHQQQYASNVRGHQPPDQRWPITPSSGPPTMGPVSPPPPPAGTPCRGARP